MSMRPAAAVYIVILKKMKVKSVALRETAAQSHQTIRFPFC